jgi:Domain of unknown function (DUF4070)/B12 binding domain/Radical SAM superfamily
MSECVRALLVCPRFDPHSFWSFEGAVEVLGAQYPTTPLGLITLAALLPSAWNVKLVDCNTEAITEDHLAWADLVMTGGMMAQQNDALRLIDRCKQRKIPVVVGGPDATSSSHVYAHADFLVTGEAENVLDDFIEAWRRGERKGIFKAEGIGEVDVTKTPIPRFDLLKFEHYLYIGIQFSRGCPFSCEFCDIIELYGQRPRAKTNQQMLTEIETIYNLGYRGHLDFVDDNLIGNKKAVKAFLPQLIAWQRAHNYPFTFGTEASLNIADDPALMTLMRDANFFGFFCGIESPDTDTLVHMSKKQNTKRRISESIKRIYDHGMLVWPGFIVGFDTEKGPVADALMECFEESALPMSYLNLLCALPNTQLTRRLEREGRLHSVVGIEEGRRQDGFRVGGLNFRTLRPRAAILTDFSEILDRLYEPSGYFGRVRRAVLPMQRVKLPARVWVLEAWRELPKFFIIMREITLRRPDMRRHAWRLVVECAIRNPTAIRNALVMTVFYFYLAPLSKLWSAATKEQAAAIEAGQWRDQDRFLAAEGARAAGLVHDPEVTT